jgi:hypothetical protein
MNGHHPLEKIKSSIKNGLIFLSMGEMEFQQISLISIKIKPHEKRILTI